MNRAGIAVEHDVGDAPFLEQVRACLGPGAPRRRKGDEAFPIAPEVLVPPVEAYPVSLGARGGKISRKFVEERPVRPLKHQETPLRALKGKLDQGQHRTSLEMKA